MKNVSRMVFVAAAALAAFSSPAWADADGRDATTRVNSLAGSISAYQARKLPIFSAAVNDRIVAIVSPANGVDVGLKLFYQPSSFSLWTQVADAGGPPGTHTRQIDYLVPAGGFYQVVIVNGWTAGNFIAATDRSLAGSTAASMSFHADTCFGAVGPNCSFFPLPGDCIRMLNGSLSCNTSVGSQKHDTCCASHPSGDWCQGLPTGGSMCADEWAIAWDDVTGGRTWRRVYDPTWVSYFGSSRVNEAAPADWAEGTANATSYLAPAGTSIRTADAGEGFCVCGTSYPDVEHPGNSICGGGCSPPPPPPPDDDECPPPPYYCP